jgi:broad specificity phosphatase PhoE
MPRIVYFITHPNVLISRDVPVPHWPLSEQGLRRMRDALLQPWIKSITSIYCSSEQKAIDGAQILATHLSQGAQQLHGLGENDRSSTGFLPPAVFEEAANRFFARPGESVSGWETAVNAQKRITNVVDSIVRTDRTTGAIAIVSHGAVGALLFCRLCGCEISRKWDQPETRSVLHGWRPIDTLPTS